MNIIKWILHGDYLDFGGLTLEQSHALDERAADEGGNRCTCDNRHLFAAQERGNWRRCKLRAGHEGQHEDIAFFKWPRPDPAPELTKLVERYKSGRATPNPTGDHS